MSDALETQTFQVTRADLIRYCGASGDFNVIHWSERLATKVGLPGVIKEVTDDGLTKLNLTATCNGDKVLSLAQATIRKR